MIKTGIHSLVNSTYGDNKLNLIVGALWYQELMMEDMWSSNNIVLTICDDPEAVGRPSFQKK